MSRTILVDRLLEFYNPFTSLDLPEEDVRDGLSYATTRSKYTEYEEDLDWHIGRIKFFVRESRRGRALDPIEVACEVCNGTVYGPVLADGHHRLAAAKIAGSKTIKANFSGRTDVLDYLAGKRKYPPEDL